MNDAVGLELVVLKEQPEDGKQIYAVYPFKMVGRGGNNFTFEAEIEPINAGSLGRQAYVCILRMISCHTVRTSAT